MGNSGRLGQLVNNIYIASFISGLISECQNLHYKTVAVKTLDKEHGLINVTSYDPIPKKLGQY